MRIDYSEPKKAYITPQGGSRPRKESTGLTATLVVITGIIMFSSGFGTGWFFSQKAAKKSFQAATAQKSLESTPRKEDIAPPKPAQPVQSAVANSSDPQTNQPQPSGANPSTPDPQLSFYKSLPSGQKSAALGSGINAKENQAKVPLQAAIPSNLTQPAPTGAETPKPASDKPAAKQSDSNAFTVQMASFPLKSEAEALKGKLASKGYHVFIVESNQGDKGIWYRVRVGKKLDQAAAKELAGKLGKSAMVIPE
jgi:cell division septation protein DedD